MLDRQTLEQLYHGEQLSLQRIGERHNVCGATIANWMKHYGIPRRTLSEAWHCKTEEGKHLDKLCAGARACKGSARWNWKPDGSKRVHDGYVLVKCTGHPRGDWVQEHILVMEQHLGRYLDGQEEVHHRNRDKAYNRLANLDLFASHSEHLLAYNHRRREV